MEQALDGGQSRAPFVRKRLESFKRLRKKLIESLGKRSPRKRSISGDLTRCPLITLLHYAFFPPPANINRPTFDDPSILITENPFVSSRELEYRIHLGELKELSRRLFLTLNVLDTLSILRKKKKKKISSREQLSR